jgi:heme/copper-type cytochrome/quinol oxidase subunit 3
MYVCAALLIATLLFTVITYNRLMTELPNMSQQAQVCSLFNICTTVLLMSSSCADW